MMQIGDNLKLGVFFLLKNYAYFFIYNNLMEKLEFVMIKKILYL